MKHAFALILAFVLSAACVLITHDIEFNVASILMSLLKLNLLVLWSWTAGKLLDMANGDNFDADKLRIDAGNLAVAVSRTGGFIGLVIAGAVLINKI